MIRKKLSKNFNPYIPSFSLFIAASKKNIFRKICKFVCSICISFHFLIEKIFSENIQKFLNRHF